MNILFYRDSLIETPDWFPQLVTKLTEVASVRIIHNRDELIDQLRWPTMDKDIVILQNGCCEELNDFVVMKEIFAGRRLIVILPDTTSEALSLGHLLHPRYLMKPGTPIEWLEAIVMQMIRPNGVRSHEYWQEPLLTMAEENPLPSVSENIHQGIIETQQNWENRDMTMANSITQSTSELAGKYLTFLLDHEVYGIKILKVQEIMGVIPATKIPCAPGFVRGIVNLRGKVIPLIDLRLKFGLEGHEDTERTCIIVVQVGAKQTLLTLGVVVDEVSEVLAIHAEQTESAPSFGANVNTDFLLGMGKVGKQVVMLLDVDRALSRGELGEVGLVDASF